VNELVSHTPIPPLTPEGLDAVKAFEGMLREQEQIEIRTHHVIHGGMYSRTIMVPGGCAITGALVKKATILVVAGEVAVFTGQGTLRLHGYNVIPASAGRKQAFYAFTDTYITMTFPTEAKTVGDAEKEFTDEHEQLMSHSNLNDIVITGE